jgi:protein ImuA
MSQGGRAERVGFLRAAIARIEAQAPQLDASAASKAVPRGRVSEILPARPGDQAAVCGFALSRAIEAAAAQPGLIVWVMEDFLNHEAGLLYGPGLSHLGVPLHRFILVRAQTARQALWAMEEALKSRACAAVIGELRDARRHFDLASTRRLQLAARAGAGEALLLHDAPLRDLSTAAELRFEVSSRASLRVTSAAKRRPIPSHPAWGLKLRKQRGMNDTLLRLNETEQEIIWTMKGQQREPLSLTLHRRQKIA